MIKILLADDDEIIRQGLQMILETQEDFEVLGVCENGQQAVELCKKTSPDVLLMDIRMPGMSGIEAASRLQGDECKILLLTTFDEPELIIAAMKIQVNGYILKSSSAEVILSAIRTVALGGTVFQKDIMDFITKQMPDRRDSGLFAELTGREHEVAGLIAKGYSNKQIGEQLFISDGTVRNHISVILNKTNLEHRTQIAVRYLQNMGEKQKD